MAALAEQLEGHLQRQERLVVDGLRAEREVDDLGPVLAHCREQLLGDPHLAADAVAVDGLVDPDGPARRDLLDDPGGEGAVTSGHIEQPVAPRGGEGVERVEVVGLAQVVLPGVPAALGGDPGVDDGHPHRLPLRRLSGRDQAQRGHRRTTAPLADDVERQDVVDRGLEALLPHLSRQLDEPVRARAPAGQDEQPAVEVGGGVPHLLHQAREQLSGLLLQRGPDEEGAPDDRGAARRAVPHHVELLHLGTGTAAALLQQLGHAGLEALGTATRGQRAPLPRHHRGVGRLLLPVAGRTDVLPSLAAVHDVDVHDRALPCSLG